MCFTVIEEEDNSDVPVVFCLPFTDSVLVFVSQRLKEKTTSNLPYMFRLPFAAGHVFSSAMLDRLLYQVLCTVDFCSHFLVCSLKIVFK